MPSALVQKLTGVRDLKKILETTVKDLGETFRAETCQVMLTNPLDPNVTSICEFRASRDEPQELLPTLTMPLVLHGRQLGSLSLTRYGDVSPDEVNAMRVILGELGDIIRGAQINDIVQRDTFRETFLVEIGNVMAYSLGIGDALFMVVNILGKVLQASRCLFICTDDSQAGWKCYEFWQQDKVQSCQEYRWPTSDSSVIAQVLLSSTPMNVYEGQVNSYISPVQEELQFIGVKSLLGVPLRSSNSTHGCVILQQCDYRRAWTRGEIDMVQNVADKVADALVKLPAEKRAREPIMQLHQRIVTHPEDEGKAPDAVSVRNALKGVLGQTAIPTARKTSAPPPPPRAPKAPTPPPPRPAATPPTAPAAQAPAAAVPPAPAAPAPGQVTAPAAQLGAAQWPQKSSDVETQVKLPKVTESEQLTATGETPVIVTPPWPEVPTISPVQSKSAELPQGQTVDGAAPNALGKILNARPTGANAAAPPTARTADDPYADLDFGDAEAAAAAAGGQTVPGPNDTWGTLDAMPAMGAQPGTAGGAGSAAAAAEAAAQAAAAASPWGAPPSAPAAADPGASAWGAPPGAAAAASVTPAPPAPLTPAAQAVENQWGNLDAIGSPKAQPAPSADKLELDSIPTPKAPPTAVGAWGDLDAIKSPGGGDSPQPHRAGGLSSMMAGKARASSANKPFSKARAAIAPSDPAAATPAAASAPTAPMSEEEAQAHAEANLKAALGKQAADQLSDYVFAAPGLDPRMAGRVSSWIQEIEEKDRYVGGHAKQVAEIAVAIAREAGLSQADVDNVRLAGLLHDVGKRACAPEVLRKKDEDLSDPELIIMMKHPIDGAELLESFPDLKHLAEVVRAHHEEYDGNGYPQGLKGNDIPVAARIVGLANGYHGLVSKMVYGDGMPPQKAQEELVKMAGKQWDPAFVQALIQAIMSRKLPAEL